MKEFFIDSDGTRIHAKLERPEGAEKGPLCILVHGFTGHMEERHITAVSRMLNEIGCAVLRIDMYGHGDSEGEFRNHTLYKWLTNVMTAVDYARTLDFVTDLYLCGHTHGGLWRIPGVCGVYAPTQGFFPKYDRGLFSFDDGKFQMIINPGFGGHGWIPRIFNLPEVSVIRLTGK